MNDLTTALPVQTGPQPAQLPLPAFDTVRNGYDQHQVDRHVNGLHGRIGDLLARLRDAEQRAAGAVVHAAESPQGQRAIVDLMKIAVDEIEGNKAAADAEIARLLDGARTQAAQITAEAQQQATGIVAGAHQQANSVLGTARMDAKTMLDEATAQATAVRDGAERRMSVVRDMHTLSLGRLEEVHRVTGQLLDAEEARGPLDNEVTRLLPDGAAVAATAPAQLAAEAATTVDIQHQ